MHVTAYDSLRASHGKHDAHTLRYCTPAAAAAIDMLAKPLAPQCQCIALDVII
jgi:hypothetical protein